MKHDTQALGPVSSNADGRNKRRRPPEPLVVKTEELVQHLREWIADHERNHPTREQIDKKRFGARDGVRHYGAERYLCDQADISPRWLTMVLQMQTQTTIMSVADDLLSAVGKGHLIGSEITIYANPAWPRERVERELLRRGVDLNHRFWEWSMSEHSANAANASDA